jgi:hypothetical protein
VARTVDAMDLPIPLEEAFDYLADFSRTAEWDPGVAEAKRLTPGAVRLAPATRRASSCPDSAGLPIHSSTSCSSASGALPCAVCASGWRGESPRPTGFLAPGRECPRAIAAAASGR